MEDWLGLFQTYIDAETAYDEKLRDLRAPYLKRIKRAENEHTAIVQCIEKEMRTAKYKLQEPDLAAILHKC